MDEDQKATPEAQAMLGEIYRTALGARTMVLMAQGKPMHEDHPHTASYPTREGSLEQMVKAEAFIGLLIEKLDAFALLFDLPSDWWITDGMREAKACQPERLIV